jgi:hypothetical protein
MNDDVWPHSIQENPNGMRLLQVADMKSHVRDSHRSGTMQGTSYRKMTSPLQEMRS